MLAKRFGGKVRLHSSVGAVGFRVHLDGAAAAPKRRGLDLGIGPGPQLLRRHHDCRIGPIDHRTVHDRPHVDRPRRWPTPGASEQPAQHTGAAAAPSVAATADTQANATTAATVLGAEDPPLTYLIYIK